MQLVACRPDERQGGAVVNSRGFYSFGLGYIYLFLSHYPILLFLILSHNFFLICLWVIAILGRKVFLNRDTYVLETFNRLTIKVPSIDVRLNICFFIYYIMFLSPFKCKDIIGTLS